MGARKGVQNVFGGGEMEDKRFLTCKSSFAHEICDSGLAYRDDSIGDSWGYAHTLMEKCQMIFYSSNEIGSFIHMGKCKQTSLEYHKTNVKV